MPRAARTAAVLSALGASLVFPAIASAVQYDVTSSDDAGAGTLRQAIADANAHANAGGPDLIVSSLPAGSTISLASALPAITDTVDLDGNASTVDVNGFDAPAGGGLFVNGSSADDSVVRELGIRGFEHRGIFVTGADGVDLLSLSVTGEGAGDVGVLVGSSAGAFELRNSTVTGNAVGIEVSTPTATILDSVIGGNSSHGVLLRSSLAGLAGNRIGVMADGTAFGNGGDGVRIENGLPFNNVIGQPGGGASVNFIENNGGNGINVVTGVANLVGVNVVRGNALETINLGGPGREENDTGDGDNGPNFLQNFPILTSARPTSIAGTLNTNANTVADVQFFADPTGGANLSTYLGSFAAETDGQGNLSFTHTPTTTLTPGWSVNAFATTQDGSGPPFRIEVVGDSAEGPPPDPPPPGPSGPFTPIGPTPLQIFPEATRRRLARQDLELSLRGRDLRTWTDYKGLDPEVNSVQGSSYRFQQEVFQPAGGKVTYSPRPALLSGARIRAVVPFQRRRRAKVVRVRRTFTRLPAGRRILVRYRLRPRRGRKLPKVIRVKLRQRFTLTRPGFQPLTVTRTRTVRVRRR
jgi:hypothetical protein